MSAYPDWNDRLRLLREYDVSVEKWRHDIMYEQVHACFVILLKVVVVVESRDGAATQHTIHFPRLVVLTNTPHIT